MFVKDKRLLSERDGLDNIKFAKCKPFRFVQT